MTSTLTSADLAPTEPDPSVEPAATDLNSSATADPAAAQHGKPDLTESAEISAAVVAMVRQFNAIKTRVTSGPEGDHSPVFLLVKLVKDGPSRAGDLAEQVCADPSTVSRQVAWLVKSGLVERQADPHDGRASILVPTEHGRIRVAEHSRRRASTMLPVIADWSEQDRRDLLRLLTKYTAGVDAHREQIIAAMLQHFEKETR
jgi:DNA-binding MarR family transcriptional regulator